MEQMTPSGFRPNYKFNKCKRCDNLRDYLSEFQICNSCCKQMEQIIPNGSKPNLKFEECKRCDNQRRDYISEFQICNSCCEQIEQKT